MAYVSGTLNDTARIVVLNSSNTTVAAAVKNSGSYKLDKFGSTRTENYDVYTVESGTIIATSTAGETISFNKVEFKQESDLPQFIPWTEPFTGTDGLYPRGHMWTRNSSNVYLNSNKLRCYVPGGGSGARAKCKSDFLIWGNFDIQIDVNAVNWPATDDWTAQMQIRYEPNVSIITNNSLTTLADFFAVRRYRTSGNNRVDAVWRIAGTSTNGTATASTITSTKFRIIRKNNTITGYYWTGSAWTSLASDIDFSGAYVGSHSPVSVQFEITNSVNFPEASTDFDNFIINYGHISYRHIESFSDYADGAPPDSAFFDSITGLASIQSSKLRLSTNASISNSYCRYKFPLKGNFDTVCSINMVAAPSSGIWHAQFRINAPDSGNSINIKRTYSGTSQNIVGTSYIGGSASSDALTSSASTVYFRLRRTGTTVYLYYSTDAATWTLLHNRSGFSVEDAYVYFNVFYTSGTPEVTCDYDIFKIVNKPFNDLKIKFPINSTN